jgi:hypothetical protein
VLPAAAGCASFSSQLKQIGASTHTPAAKNFTVTARVSTVVIDGGASSITVTGSGRDTIFVSQESTYTKTPPTTSSKVAGTTLTLSYGCTAQLVCGVAYNVLVPAGITVTVSTRAGAITLTSLSGTVTAHTDAGLITASELTSATAELTSNAGGIVATFSDPPSSIHASTNIGPITITVPGSAAYDVSTHTYVGSSTVTVRKNAASSHAITASSDLGSITISPG